MASCYNIGRYSMVSLAVSAPFDFHHLSAQEHHPTWKVIDLHTDQTYYLHRVGTTFERFKSLKALNQSREAKNEAPLSGKGARFYTFQKGWFYGSLNPVNKRQFKQFIQSQQNQQSRLQAIKAATLGLLATLHGTGGFSSSPGHTAVELLSSSAHAVSTLKVPLLAAGVLSTALPSAAATASASFIPGAEFRVNTYTTSDQDFSTLTALQGGGFVVAWRSNEQDGDGYGVYGQRFDASGQKAGVEFPINNYTLSDQDSPSITALKDGGFVVIWTSRGQDGSEYGVYGQRFDANSGRLDLEFPVNTYNNSFQSDPCVAALKDGGCVVIWQSSGQDGDGFGLYGQRFGASGQKLGMEFPVNTYTASNQINPSAASLKSGDFVVAWVSSGGQDGDGYGIYGQRFDASAAKIGLEFPINTYTPSTQGNPSVTALQDGGFVVTWNSVKQDGDDYGVYGQRFDASGTRAGLEFPVNTYTTSRQSFPSLTTLSDGSFVVAWSSRGQDGDDYGVYGQRFDSAGQKAGDEFLINSYTTSQQNFPSVAALKNGGFVVTWSSLEQDGSGFGIYGRIFFLNQAIEGTTIPANTIALYAGVSAAVAAVACSLFGALALCFVRTRNGKRKKVSEGETTQTSPIGSVSNDHSLPQLGLSGRPASVETSHAPQAGPVFIRSGIGPEQNMGYNSPPIAQTTETYGNFSFQSW